MDIPDGNTILQWTQAIGTILVGITLILWHKSYRDAKNAVIELKDERLKHKDDQIEALKEKNAVLEVLSAKFVVENVNAQKSLYEERIGKSEQRIKYLESELANKQKELAHRQVEQEATVELTDKLQAEVASLHDQLEQQQSELKRLRDSEREFQEKKLKDVYAAHWLSPESVSDLARSDFVAKLFADWRSRSSETGQNETNPWRALFGLAVKDVTSWKDAATRVKVTDDQDKPEKTDPKKDE